MYQNNDNSYNEVLQDGRMMRMISMLQPLGERRRLRKINYLFLNSDYIADEPIKINNKQCPGQLIIDTQSEKYKKAIDKRNQLSNIVKQDVEKISKVFRYSEQDFKQRERGQFFEYQYCMDSRNQIRPQDAINNFFQIATDGSQIDGFVIYFSGQITEGVPCMAFQIRNEVHFVTVHQILELWRKFLNGYREKKHLFLIIESPCSSQFLDQIHQSKERVDQYNVSFLFSEREKRTTRSQINSYLKQYEEYQKVIKQRVNDEDKTPQNFILKQDNVWRIEDYAGCSGFTAALCEHLLNSPPKRIEQLYQSRIEFYLNKYVVQPGFFGFAAKNYLDFGWYMDINYYRIQQQSSINFYGIKRSHFNLPMEQISIEQEQNIYKGFNYFGLVKNKKTDVLIHDPMLLKKQKELEQQTELLNAKIEENKISEAKNEVKSYVSQQSVLEDYNFQSGDEENNLTRNCNGFQIYEDGSKYIGQWFNNKQNGIGVAIYKNGDRYEGEFVDGKQCGQGYLYTKRTIYAGQFYNNMYFGKGIVIWWARLRNNCFVGNFNDRQATGYAYRLDNSRETKLFGIISDKHQFNQYYEDHELNMDVPEEESMFSCNKDVYEFDFNYNSLEMKCNFKKQFNEYLEKQEQFKKKAEENLKMLIFQQVQPKQEVPGLDEQGQQLQQVEEQQFAIPDVTQLPQYEEFKEDLNDLNPDMQEDNIKPQDVEFLLKHAVCKVEIQEEEKIQKEEKTLEVIQQIDDMLDDFENIQLQPVQKNQQPLEQKEIKQPPQEIGQQQIQEEQKNEEAGNQQQEKIQIESKNEKQEQLPLQQPEQQIQETAEQKAIQARLALIPLVAMKEYYKKQEGIDLYVSNEKVEQDMSQQFKQSMLNIGQAENNKFMKIRIQDDANVSFNKTILDDQQKEKFIKKFKKNAAKAYGCKPEDIIIFGLSKGSINVEFKLRDELYIKLNDSNQVIDFFKNKCNYKGAELRVHNLLEYATLTPENCDPSFNFDWSKEPEGKISYRGGLTIKNKGFKKQHYIFPSGWKGFGLNISKYKDKEWIGYVNGKPTYNSKEQWIVLYHGTSIQGVEGITKEGFRLGQHHKYAGAKCRITGKIIEKSSKCVYLTDDANVAGRYSTPFEIKGKAYQMVFQCRVNPKVVRSPKEKPDYYIIEESGQPQQNIRPYRILLKKLDEKEYKEFQENQEKIRQNYQDQNEAQYQLQKLLREQEEESGKREEIQYYVESSESDNESEQDKFENNKLLKNILNNDQPKNKQNNQQLKNQLHIPMSN
ncbi:MORN domain protein (macronuclear) [Tetrahymena thermophila SB210]|uniref:MORN domain protein n=1 Tax=Tetrahymena thermophila (strain SB210) TaxID=312017 RepID=Q23MB7_TETTS|nr:MORN domain protein [Tetrahymena thermophila SB210]EAR97722.2 MORN domain protein [Tetrahymena thermophila SB210]|eukprot:XP_001017967.2 MORN domain protein [Tetrahymena thermophila SB210]